jgi:hypothetical protein
VLALMHIPNDPDPLLLKRMQNIFVEKPILLELLQKYEPKDINLPTLLEVLDSLKSNGVADVDIESYLEAPST